QLHPALLHFDVVVDRLLGEIRQCCSWRGLVELQSFFERLDGVAILLRGKLQPLGADLYQGIYALSGIARHGAQHFGRIERRALLDGLKKMTALLGSDFRPALLSFDESLDALTRPLAEGRRWRVAGEAHSFFDRFERQRVLLGGKLDPLLL